MLPKALLLAGLRVPMGVSMRFCFWRRQIVKRSKVEKMRKDDSNKFIFSSKETAEFFGVDPDTITLWAKKGAPKLIRNG